MCRSRKKRAWKCKECATSLFSGDGMDVGEYILEICGNGVSVFGREMKSEGGREREKEGIEAVRNNIPKILYSIPVEYLSTHFIEIQRNWIVCVCWWWW